MLGTEFRQKLGRQACFGTFLKLPRPEVVDLLALAGFDFVICDMEHAQITESEARTVIRAAVAAHLPVVVRLPDPEQGIVNRLLEAGAVGIQMPRLRTTEHTRRLHAMTHFPPRGVRSVGNANPLAGYGTVGATTYLQRADANVLLVGQFETRQIDDPIAPMLDGLDVAFIGPMDLSVDFGVPGQFGDPAVQARIAQIEAAVAPTSTVMGAFAGSVEAARQYVAKGYRYVAVSGDVSLLLGAARTMVQALREAGRPAATA